MNRRLFRLIAFFVLASSCGDRPWPMDNPNDPLRCDPQCQSPFVCENAICVYDPCKLNACNGNGTCAADVATQTFTCQCNEGWSGTQCDGCADGYTGYPDCHCQCSSGQTECDGQSLKTCNSSSCSWTSQTCAEICQSTNPSSSFCTSNTKNLSGQCYCPSATLDFKITASCSFSVAIYDDTIGAAISSTGSISPSSPFSDNVACVPGNNICWGAWSEKYYGGCGNGCSQSCAGCCTKCPSSGTVATSPDYNINLNCTSAGTGGTGGSRGTGGTGGSRGTGGTGGSSKSTGGRSGSGGKGGSAGKGGSGGSRVTTPAVDCSEFSMPDCEVGSLSISIGDTCIYAGCHFDLGDCTTHGDGFSSYQTCECRCYK